MGELGKVIFWNDGAPHIFVPSLYLHSLFISAEILHCNGTIMAMAYHDKELMDGFKGLIKRFVHGLVKSRRINTKTAAEFAAEASKGVPSIKYFYLSQEGEIIDPSYVKNAGAIKRTLDLHHIKRDYNPENFWFFLVLLCSI